MYIRVDVYMLIKYTHKSRSSPHSKLALSGPRLFPIYVYDYYYYYYSLSDITQDPVCRSVASTPFPCHFLIMMVRARVRRSYSYIILLYSIKRVR